MTFILKLLELSKTRAKKSSPDMFNFYVVLVGHNKVSDAGRVAMCWLKFKAPSLKTKSTKNEGPFGNMNKFSEKNRQEFSRKPKYAQIQEDPSRSGNG